MMRFGAISFGLRTLLLTAAFQSALLVATPLVVAQQPRALGIDVSAWQGGLLDWNALHNTNNRDFAFIRASRGGTAGYDHLRGGYPASDPDNNDAFNLSQRYDDPWFAHNITAATSVGMFAGPYHFGRMDVIASTPNTNGVANDGTDEANHFLQMAGAWMRPGYLLPVFDFEAGSGVRSPSELAQFAIDFSNRIYEVKGIRPAVYIGNNYANPMNSIPESAAIVTAYPTLWTARWPNQTDPDSIPVQTADPGDYTSSVYGPWDNPPNGADPWHFWQYASTARLSGYNNGNSNIDVDVAKGGTEFLKDQLVPAIWVPDSSGDWNDLSKWNSGQTPVPPAGPPEVPSCGTCTAGTGQLTPLGTHALPTPRLPGVDDTARGVDGQNDTVILDRGAANPTITLSSGTHNIRKLYVRESLNITGGSLTINYDNPKYAANSPLRDPASTLISAQFSAPVSLSGGASLSVYRLQIDPAQTFTLAGGALTFNQIDLMPDAANPAKIAMTGSVNFNAYENGTASILNGAGSGSFGYIDLGGAARTFNVANGTSSIDMSIGVPITNGSLTKTGLGTLNLTAANTYGDTRVQSGTLRVGMTSLATTGDVHLATGGKLDLAFDGGREIHALYLEGLPAATGIWGPTGSGAQHTSSFITGTGRLFVGVSPPPPPSGPGNVLDDFEVDQGHFGWFYGFSPQTVGFNENDPSATSVTRVVGEHHGIGAASQLLNLVPDVSDGNANWELRHNSGIGQIAHPSGNVPLTPTGWVGFWLKTDDPTAGTIQISVDDPVPAGATAIEKGEPKQIIADNQWHLYQWNFEDDDDWVPFNAGTNGAIDAVNGAITIDSIWITGSGNVQLYLDTVSHNPNGMLAAIIPGDYDRNGVVEMADYNVWRSAFGHAVAPGASADGTNDGIIDMGDYLMWRKQMSAGGSGGGGLSGTSSSEGQSSVPEPSAMLLIFSAVGLWLARRR